MTAVTITDKEAGAIVSRSADEKTGNVLSNGDVYLDFSRVASSAQAPENSRGIFRITQPVAEGLEPAKNVSILGSAGKDNVLVLPGKEEDYKVKVAQDPQGLGGKQKMGDVTFVDKDGKSVHTTNVKSVAFLGDAQVSPAEVVDGLASGKIATRPTKDMHDKAYAALPVIDQCKLQAVTSDEAAKAFPAKDKLRTQEKIDAAQGAAMAKASKSCPSR